MIKNKFFLLLLIMMMILLLTGCWNYRGLNEMAIVVGVAVDKNLKNGDYQLTFEFVDISVPVKEKGPSGKLLEAEGKTIFDAVRNAKKRADNKLYFGHTQLLIIGQDVVKNEDISNILDIFMRDAECRETLYVTISQEATASAMLKLNGVDQSILSLKIMEIIRSDNKITASTLDVELFNVYTALREEGKELALCALHSVVNNNESTCEVNGSAIFKGERLAGFLSAEETKYYLFIIDSIHGGLLVLSSQPGGVVDTTLEIYMNKTERTMATKDGRLRIALKTNTVVYLGEFMRPGVDLDENVLTELERVSAIALQKNICSVIKKVQTNYGSDIFGFGNQIYKHDFRLWEQLKDDWPTTFQSLEVDVQCDVRISNTQYLASS